MYTSINAYEYNTMYRTQIYLTQVERESLHSLIKMTGKTQSELIRQAIDQFIGHQQAAKENKVAAIKAAEGMWKERTDMCDFATLRDEWDRNKDHGSKEDK
jgi:metal-responsive CopG/Arc/MetJ family transcriptional regulator